MAIKKVTALRQVMKAFEQPLCQSKNKAINQERTGQKRKKALTECMGLYEFLLQIKAGLLVGRIEMVHFGGEERSINIKKLSRG